MTPYRTPDALCVHRQPSALRRAWWAVRRWWDGESDYRPDYANGVVYRALFYGAHPEEFPVLQRVEPQDVPIHWRWHIWGET